MNAQDTRPTPPAWFNIDAVIDDETCAEMHRLGDLIEAAIDDLAPTLESCYRIQRRFSDATATADLEEGASDAIYVHSGAQRLSDLLYLLAAHVDGAAGEHVDGIHDIAWLKRARAELGLDEWNFPASAGK
jgi:hypothetical protein